MRTPAILCAAALLAATPLGASAFPESPAPLVTVSTTGACPTGYTSYFNFQSTHVCVREPSLNPDVMVTDTGCPAGYIETGSDRVGQWVCVRV